MDGGGLVSRSSTGSRDPLDALVIAHDPAVGVWRSDRSTVYVAEADVAREVMANRSGDFVDTSDFFHLRRGIFGPRATQVGIGRAGRTLLQTHLDAHRDALPSLLRRSLTTATTWPDAANLMLYEFFQDALLRPGAPPEVRAVVDAVVTRAVLAGAPGRHSGPSRWRFRRRMRRVLGRHMRERRRRHGEPLDLMDVVAAHADAGDPDADLVEIYLSFLFATVGSLGFALAWAVLLCASHPEAIGPGIRPQWIVHEAMRMWPVAWLFGRTPARAHTLGGVAVNPTDEVRVCAYLAHRDARHWSRPDSFEPARWAAGGPHRAYLPFGLGPHTCAGLSVVLDMLCTLVDALVLRSRLTVTLTGQPRFPGPALSPPRFVLEVSPLVPRPEGR